MLHLVPRRVPFRRAVLVLVVVLAASACLPMAAVRPDNRVLPVPGERNGALPAGLLADLDVDLGPGCRIHVGAAPSLAALLAAARRDGVALEARECYRDLAGQQWWRTWWCQQGRCANAAVPGTSSHGWAKAVDLAEPGGMTATSPGTRWLEARVGFYGWNHPGWARPGGAAPEPWHWEWVGDGGALLAGSVQVA